MRFLYRLFSRRPGRVLSGFYGRFHFRLEFE